MAYKKYLKKLKRKNSIFAVAVELGWRGSPAGNKTYNGPCPNHHSTSGRCLVIWSNIQYFKCYHEEMGKGCGAKGDVIELCQLFRKCSHQDAVNALAARVKMPPFQWKDLSAEEIKEQERQVDEESLVFKMLTTAQEWMHERLNERKDLKNNLILDKRKHPEEYVNETKIGWMPVTKKGDGTSELADYLSSFPEFKDKLHLCGLFSFSLKEDGTPDINRYWDFFKGRIVHPYWRGGQAVYMIGRAVEGETPEDQFECYNDRQAILDEDGNYVSHILYKHKSRKNRDDTGPLICRMDEDGHLYVKDEEGHRNYNDVNEKPYNLAEFVPDYLKFKKLRTYQTDDSIVITEDIDPEHDEMERPADELALKGNKRKFISKCIQNDTFMGEDNAIGAEKIIITEGVDDYHSLASRGFKVISPVTTSFRDQDHEKLGELTRNAKTIYIVNDNEENEAGLAGAIKTATYLTKLGRDVRLVELPRDKHHYDKIDVNDYFAVLGHDEVDFQLMLDESKSFFEQEIDRLSRDDPYIDATLRETIFPIMKTFGSIKQEVTINRLAAKLDMRKTIIKDGFVSYRKNSKEKVNDQVENSLLTGEEENNPLFSSGVLKKNKFGETAVDIIKFQEYVCKNHRIKFITGPNEDSRAFYVYDENCYKLFKGTQINSLCQMELGDYRTAFRESTLREFTHFIYGDKNVLMNEEKANEGRRRYLTLENGLFDLHERILIPHTPDIFTTNPLPYPYDPDAKYSRWIRYLNEVFPGDKGLINFVQEAVGYIFHKGMPTASIFFLIGEGDNGKSQFIEVLCGLVGEANSTNISLNQLQKEEHVVDLCDAMLNYSDESKRRLRETDILKKVTDGNRVRGRGLYKDPTEFAPFAKHWILMNRKTQIDDTSKGMWRRIYRIDFLQEFKGDRAEKDLGEKIISKDHYNELSGIFNWALEGLQRLEENNWDFSVTKRMEESKEQYRIETNSVLAFIREKLNREESKDSTISRVDLLREYRPFCVEENYKPEGATSFQEEMERAGFKFQKLSRDNGKLHCLGVSWKIPPLKDQF